MEIRLVNIAKAYHHHTLFKDLNYSFTSPGIYGLIGNNGSGKSSLLKLISGTVIPSKGQVDYLDNEGKIIDEANWFKHLAISAPYMDLPEQLSLKELFEFHSKFIPLKINYENFIALLKLENDELKTIQYFSSGMKQRLQLALAFFSHKKILLLDEPCSNLDEFGINLFHHFMQTECNDRIVIIASNENTFELKHVQTSLNVMNYK